MGTRYSIDPPGNETVQVAFGVPVLVGGIDPVQEAKLVGLSSAMVHGSYLREGEGLSAPVLAKFGRQFKTAYRTLPLIASSRTFVDEALQVRVQRLRVGGGSAGLPERLASPGGGDFIDALQGQTVLDRTFSPAALYRVTLAGFTGASPQSLSNYWTTGPVRYEVVGRRAVAPVVVTNPTSAWEPIGQAMIQTASAAPGANATQFRRLTHMT